MSEFALNRFFKFIESFSKTVRTKKNGCRELELEAFQCNKVFQPKDCKNVFILNTKILVFLRIRRKLLKFQICDKKFNNKCLSFFLN